MLNEGIIIGVCCTFLGLISVIAGWVMWACRKELFTKVVKRTDIEDTSLPKQFINFNDQSPEAGKVLVIYFEGGRVENNWWHYNGLWHFGMDVKILDVAVGWRYKNVES